MALDNTAPILDLLTVNNFVLEIERLPGVKFMVQSVSLPDVSLGEVGYPSPFQNIKAVGERCEFGNVTAQFLVDEELRNWQTIYYWMTGLGFPKEFDEFKSFAGGHYDKHGIKGVEFSQHSGGFQFSDISLVVVSNHKNPILEFRFQDCFPTSLGGVSMSVTNTDAEPITSSVTFQFTGMDIKIIK